MFHFTLLCVSTFRDSFACKKKKQDVFSVVFNNEARLAVFGGSGSLPAAEGWLRKRKTTYGDRPKYQPTEENDSSVNTEHDSVRYFKQCLETFLTIAVGAQSSVWQGSICVQFSVWQGTVPLSGRALSVSRPLSGRVLSVSRPLSGRILSVSSPLPGRVLSVPSPLSGRILSVPSPLSGRAQFLCLAGCCRCPVLCLRSVIPQPRHRSTVAPFHGRR